MLNCHKHSVTLFQAGSPMPTPWHACSSISKEPSDGQSDITMSCHLGLDVGCIRAVVPSYDEEIYK